MTQQKTTLALAVASVLAAAPAVADNAAGVDTSGWKCESCPFQTEYEADVEAGVLYADEDSAKFGEYNGLDEKGAYADLSAAGGGRSESGTYYEYDLVDLGLDTREANLALGKEGLGEARLSYDEIPHRVWDTTVTPYAKSGKDTLVLPTGWVRSGSTAGMTALGTALSPVDVGTDRSAIGLGLDYLFGSNLKFFADYNRQEIEGSKLASANFLFQSLQFAQPVDAAHDQFELGAVYRFARGYARLSWYGSVYDNSLSGITFDNPYVPLATDTVQGRTAAAPGNKAQTYALDGNLLLPWWDTVLSYRLAEGTMDQDEDFLPYSTSAALSAGLVAPRGNLAGDVSTSHYRATLSAKPHPRFRARVGYRYDERDDGTKPFTSAFVEDDSVPSPATTTVQYGYERSRLDGYGEVRILDWLFLGAGGESDTVERRSQATDETEETAGYGQIRLRPWSSFEMRLRGGESHIEAGDYVVTPGAPPENPLLRKFNQTNRDRDYADLRIGWSPSKFAVALEGTYAYDAYRLSPLGLISGRDYRYAATVSMPFAETASVYLSGSLQNIATEQAGEETYPTGGLPWQVLHEDEFTTIGGGVVWNDIAGKWDLSLDYTYAKAQGDIESLTTPPSVGGAFPELATELNSLRLSASYDVNDRLRVGVAWTWEDYESSDWQIGGVEPATLPNLLSMSPDPYDYSVNVIGVSFSYRFGGPAAEEEAAEGEAGD